MSDGFRIVHIRFKRDKSGISLVLRRWPTNQFGSLVQHAMRVSGPSRDERAERAFEDLLMDATAYRRLPDASGIESLSQLLVGSSCDEKYVKAFAQVAKVKLSRWSCRLCDMGDV